MEKAFRLKTVLALLRHMDGIVDSMSQIVLDDLHDTDSSQDAWDYQDSVWNRVKPMRLLLRDMNNDLNTVASLVAPNGVRPCEDPFGNAEIVGVIR